MRLALRTDAPPAPVSARRHVLALAGAAMAANALAVLFTVIFARVLGAGDYGSLAALVSALLILSVPGSALQVAVARDVAAGRYGAAARLSATVQGWLGRLLAMLGAMAAVSLLARDLVAAAIGVEEGWAAAAVLPGAVVWLMLCVLRGSLQGVAAVRPVALSIVGEAVGRLALGGLLVVAGAGVTGAFLGTPLAFAVTTVALAVVLRRRAGTPAHLPSAPRLRALGASAGTAIAALTLIMVLQNIDVILVKHRLAAADAGAYAATAVAAKVLIWVAIGVALHVVPEAARRAARGQPPLGALKHALVVIAGLAVPVLALYATVPELLLRIGFGEEYVRAHRALLPLGLAMTLLACCYLGAQYLVALRHGAFLWILASAVAVEVPALALVGDSPLSVALVVLGVQAATVGAMLAVATRARPRGAVAEAAA